MSPTRRYVLASLALGALAVWASENAFWFVPHDAPSPAEAVLLWLLYATASAAGLSAVLWSGVGGWAAAFLGGSVMGWGVEGLVLSTAYDAFPVQLVWTPLAWHGLLTGGVVLALSRGRMGWARRAGLWAAVGAGMAVWGQYWGAVHAHPLIGAGLGLYLLGAAVVPVAAGLALDRLGLLPVPRRRVLLVAPALLALAWAVQTAMAPSPVRLAAIPMLGLLLWVMRGVGGGPAPLDLGGPRRPEQHLLLLLAPAVALALAPALRASGLPLAGSNWVVAGATVLGSLAALGALALRARRARAGRAAGPPSPGSRAAAGP